MTLTIPDDTAQSITEMDWHRILESTFENPYDRVLAIAHFEMNLTQTEMANMFMLRTNNDVEHPMASSLRANMCKRIAVIRSKLMRSMNAHS